MTTLNEFLNDMIAKSNAVPEDEPSYDYEAMAFEAGIEFAAKKIKEFIAQNPQPEQKISLPEYLDILYALSRHREDEDFGDRDIGWEESGYRSALYDVRKYLQNDETYISRTLEEYEELEPNED